MTAEGTFAGPPRARHSIAGVFEGGGAKGLAYIGALEAVLEADCWFRRVAGASAGAITAALVAAGFTPAEIRAHAPVALSHLQCRRWRGVWNLTRTGGYFRKEPLLTWLDDLLTRQAGRLKAAQPDKRIPKLLPGPVTFAELFALTGIELNVAAVDLSLKRQIVFSAWDTPDCEVAHAVLASASIPFVFAPAEFTTDDPGGDNRNARFAHTVVDGGVWANFPMYIFTDRTFREVSGRAQDLGDEFVVGFVFEEETKDPEPSLWTISFRDDVPRWLLKPWERRKEQRRSAKGRERLLSAVFLPFRMLAHVAALVSTFNPFPEVARWPLPPGGALRHVLDLADKTAVVLARPVVGLLAWLLLAVSAAPGLARLLEYFTGRRGESWAEQLVDTALILIVSGVMAAVLLALVALLIALVANIVLLPALRRVLYGLVVTYVDAPGAPPWAAYRDDVIALPIPAGVSMLSFDLVQRDPEGYARLLDTARTATRAGLERILSQPARKELEGARARLESGDVEGACEGFRRVMARAHPNLSPSAGMLLGEALEKRGDLAGARVAIESVVASGHAELAPVARVALAGMLARTKQWEDARRQLQPAIESGHPLAVAEAHVLLGCVQYVLGEDADARRSFAHALEAAEPLTALNAAVNLVVLLGTTPPIDESEIRRVLTHAIRIDDAAPVGRYEQPSSWTAIRFALSRRRPLRSSAALLSVGLMAAEDADFDRARAFLAEALLVAMRDRDASEQLIRLYVGDVENKLRGADAAEGAWRAAFKSGDPDAAPEAAVRLGQLHAARGELDAAMELFRSAMASPRKHSARAAAVRLALLHFEHGNKDEGMAVLLPLAGT
jgi:predicted acylesterase/phospholipase RssA/tetratricopeptide (TPR) repeat protein